jgi:hypothetical protein
MQNQGALKKSAKSLASDSFKIIHSAQNGDGIPIKSNPSSRPENHRQTTRTASYITGRGLNHEWDWPFAYLYGI